MSSSFINDSAFEAAMEEERLEEARRSLSLRPMGRIVPNFADPKALRPFKAGYEPEANDVYNATMAYLNSSPEGQFAIDLQVQKSIDPSVFTMKTSKEATVEDRARTFGYTGRDGVARMQEMLDSMTPEEREENDKAYDMIAAGMNERERIANELIAKPEMFPELAIMKQKVALGDSLFRRGVNALSNSVVGTIDTSRRGIEELSIDVAYAGTKALYGLGGLADHIFNTRISDPAERDEILNFLRDAGEEVRNSAYVPPIISGGNLYEDFVGTLGSLGSYVVAGSISPYLSAGLIYSSGYSAVREEIGDADPVTALAASSVLGAGYGWINQIALKTWMSGIRNPLKFGAASLARQSTAEYIADFSSVIIEHGAYALGGSLTGDLREPIPFTKTLKDAAYAGALGAAGSLLLGGAQVPKWISASKQHRAFRTAHTSLVDSLTKIMSLDTDGNLVGSDAAMKIISDYMKENSLKPNTYFRATDVVSLGDKSVKIFLEETGITQEQMDTAVKFDLDLVVDTTDALMASARSNLANGRVVQNSADGLKAMPGSNKIAFQRAKILAKAIDGNPEAVDEIGAYRTRIGLQTGSDDLQPLRDKLAEFAGKQLTDAEAGELRELAEKLLTTPESPASLSDFVRPDSFSPALKEISNSEDMMRAVIAEFDSRERISELDNVPLIRDLRDELMTITQNSGYVSSTMHIVKSMLDFLARQNNMSAVEYANTFAINTVLSDKSLNIIYDTSRQMRDLLAEDAGEVSVESLRRSQALTKQANQLQWLLDKGTELSNSLMKTLGLGDVAVDQTGIVKSVQDHIESLKRQAEEARRARPSGEITAEQKRGLRIKGALDKISERAYQTLLVRGEMSYSTFPHEFFHVFLDLARTDAPVWFAELEKTVGKPLFTKKGTATREQEVLAGQFEAYLREGKAPSVGLSRVFRDYKRFLGSEDIRSFAARKKISPDLHLLFDQMFSDKLQMQLAETLSGFTKSLIDANTPKAEELKKKEERVKLTAEELRNKKILKIYTDMNPQIKTGIMEEVTADVNGRKDTKLWNILMDEKVVNKKALRDGDLDKAIKDYQRFDEVVVDIMGPEMSRDDALALLKTLRSPKETIRIEYKIKVQQAMQAIMNAIPQDLALEALHNPDMSDYLDSLQMAIDEHLIREKNNKVGRTRRQYEASAIKDAADKLFGGFTFSEAMNYKKFVGEFKSSIVKYVKARDAGDVEGMSKHLNNARLKERLINNAVAARDLGRMLDKKFDTESKVAKLVKPTKMLPAYADAIRGIIGRYFNKKIKYIDGPIVLEGTDPTMNPIDIIAPWIQTFANSNVKSYKDLTYSQVMDLNNAITFLTKFGKTALDSFLETRYADVEARVGASLELMRPLDKRPETYRKDKTLRGLVGRMSDAMSRYALLTEFLFSRADGFSDISGKGYGPLREMHINVRNHFAVGESLAVTYASKVLPHFQTLMARTKRFKTEILPRLGPIPSEVTRITGAKAWTNEMTIMMFMQIGNAGNLRTLTKGYNMSMDQINTIVTSFTEAERNAAVSIAKELNPLFKASEETKFRLTGLRTKPVETTGTIWFDDAGNEIHVEGFYFPISTYNNSDKGSDFLKRVMRKSDDPTHNFLEERTGTERAARLEISVLGNLIDAETHYIATAEVLHDSNKVLRDERFAKMFTDKFGKERYQEVLRHYEDIANPQGIYDAGNDIGTKSMNYLRSAGIAASLGFNVASSLKQRMDVLPSLINMIQHNRERATWSDNIKYVFEAALNMGFSKNQIGLSKDVSLDSSGNPVVDGKVVSPDSLDPIQFAAWKSAVFRSSVNRADLNLDSVAKKHVGVEKSINVWGHAISLRDVNDAAFTFIKWSDKWMRAVIWNAQYKMSMAGKGTFDIADLSIAEREAKAIQDADTISLNMASNMVTDMTYAQRHAYLRAFTPFITAQVRKGATGWQYVRAAQVGAISWKEAFAGLASIAYGPMVMIGGMNLLIDAVFDVDDEERKKRPDGVGFVKGILMQPILTAFDSAPILNIVSSGLNGYNPQLLSLRTGESILNTFNKVTKSANEGSFTDAMYASVTLGAILTKVPVHNIGKQAYSALKRTGFIKETRRDGKVVGEWNF